MSRIQGRFETLARANREFQRNLHALLAREIRRRVPRVALDVVPGVGHNVLLEAPEHVARTLLGGVGARA